MNKFRKMLAVACAFAIVMSTFVVAFSFSASAATDGVAYEFNAYGRRYAHGEFPQTVEYSDNGYVILKDEGRYRQQSQVYFGHFTDAEKKQFVDAVTLANDEYDGTLYIDINVKECLGSNKNQAEGYEGAPEIKVALTCRYKDPDYVDEDNPEGYTSITIPAQSWSSMGVKSFKLPVDEFSALMTDYEGFELSSVGIHIMDYASLAFVEGDYTGQKGRGFFDIECSPLMVSGAVDATPAIGENIGKCVEFIPNEADEKAAGKYIIGDYEYPQLTEDAEGKTSGDGEFGNGLDPDRKNGVFIGEVSTAVYGDANEDGKINMADVLLLRKYLAKWNVTLNEANADVNGDTKINMADVLLLRKYLAKWNVTLGPQK